MSNQLNDIVEQLSKLSVLELSQLKQLLEDKWGVKAAAAAVAVAAPAAGGAAAAPEAEATDFQVILDSYPADKKLNLVKVVRELTGLGLKESKELVEAAPKAVKDTAPKAEAEQIKQKLEEAGGKVVLKPL